ncbi:OmpA family protein, partial [bacterium]|nr:OmpA family protein [bacterium]
VVLVLIVVVTIFVVTQTGLVNVLGAKETALARLSQQLSRLELDLKRSETRSLLLQGEVQGALTLLQETRTNFAETIGHLTETRQSLDTTQSDLDQTQSRLSAASQDLTATLDRLQNVRQEKEQTKEELEASANQINLLSERIAQYLEQITLLNSQLSTYKQEMTSKNASLGDLNASLEAMNSQVKALSAQLSQAETQSTEQRLELAKLLTEIEKRDVEITRLRQFEKYRSEFLARLSTVFTGLDDIKISGDRFVFQGEVLFDSGKADLRSDGQKLLDRVVKIYNDLEGRIPADIGFNIQIQGHTDTDPINTPRFPSNWELSTARATEVVKYLISQGVPQSYLSAAGFGEFYPAAPGASEDAKRQNRRIEIRFTRR